MLKQDTTAGIIYFVTGVFRKRKTYRFVTSNRWWNLIWDETQFQAAMAEQERAPILIVSDTSIGRQYWMFQGIFYWDNEWFSAQVVHGLILERNDRRERQAQRAIARATMPSSESQVSREPIPREVQHFVWQRDQGKCVQCGSQRNLEYDHIIPFSKGGSNTARNLQLLCGQCNRSKGANIG